MDEWQDGVGKRTMSKRTASAWNVFVVADIMCKSGGGGGRRGRKIVWG